MMTREDIDILLTPEARAAVEANLGNDPLRIALDRRVPHAALVATQVKYMQRAAAKLPSFHAARCIIPPLAYEQSSSEVTALNKRGSGRLAVDLTCGLGVDAWALSRRFERVVAVERDPVTARLAEVNFRLLGATNIEVVNSTAEEFAAHGVEADLIYIDADRRGARGQKLVLPQDCSPNVMELLPRLHGRVMLKLSPMFDVDEARRIFGRGVRVEVVSSGGECREVIVETGGDATAGTIAATILGCGTVEYAADTPPTISVPMPAFEYLVAPDAALVKARVAVRHFTERGLYIENDNSYAFAAEAPGIVPGHAYRIVRATRYSPRELARELKADAVKRADIMPRNFPHTAQQIARQLGVSEGGRRQIAFARVGGRLWSLFIEPV